MRSGWWPLVAALCLALLAAMPAHGQQEAAWPPQLEIAGPLATDPAARIHLAADRAWLGSQPPALLLAPPTDAEGEALAVWLRRAERLNAPPVGETDGAATPEDREAEAPVSGQRDLLSLLRDRWLERGYLAASVQADSTGAALVLQVDPGPLHTLGEIAVEGEAFPGRQGLLDLWLPRPGEPFLPEEYLLLAAEVVAACAERGYPFPLWLTRTLTIDPAQATVSITAVLVPGPRMFVGPQRSNLPAGRGEDFLIRAAGLREGSLFRESDLSRGRDRLLVRDLYARVDEPVVHLTASRDTVGIIWQVEPQPRPGRLAVVLGLSRREEGGTRLSGQVDLDLPNLAGTGRRLSAGWRDDGLTRSRFGFSYLEPLVAGTPLDGELALESEVQEDAFTRFTIDNRWRLPVVSLWGLQMGLGWDRTTYPTGDLEGVRRLRWRMGVLRSRGDRAQSGWSGAFAVETVSRSSHLREPDAGAGGQQLGRQDSQRLLEVDLDGELWLRQELSLAARASLRRIDTDERPVPLPEQYRFGGANSLRGYREDEFNGETAAYGGVEVRVGRARRSRVYTFVDVGYFDVSVRAPGADGQLLGRNGTRVGFGLGLLTVAAPGHINLAIGFPGDVDFETAKLHVSLLGSF